MNAALAPPQEKPSPPQQSRLTLQQLNHRQDGGGEYQPDMPPLLGFEDLLNLLFEIGPVMCGEMGTGPLTHGEIESAQHNLGIRLSPFECRTLHRLSIEYFNELHLAKKRDAKAPWQPNDAPAKRKSKRRSN